MRSTFAPLFVLGSLLGVAVAQTALFINTPTNPPAVFCEPLLIQWGGGTPNYFVSVVDPTDPSNTFVSFGELSNTSISWLVTEPVGTSLLLSVRDSTGTGETSAPFTVGGGGPASCGTTSASGSSTSGSTSSTGSSVSTSVSTTKTTSTLTSVSTTQPASTVASTTPSASSPSATKPTSSGSVPSSPSSSTSSSGAAPTAFPGAAAAAALGAGAAFFAAVL
ncbi:hypothetical protein DFH07DRAFT_804409 [Mycena maculata]|uniref:Uncharacterized protein n=1 Tax=Mycena maculata TaxID=230809 RepID=A0AAD7JSN0_9AGAR|nr:hypothetical protein DFH07DRAFT_804409 [Mycena maculata]